MRGVSNVSLRPVQGMSIDEMIELIEEMGYSTEALSNEEIYEIAISVIDGHADEDDGEELDFHDD